MDILRMTLTLALLVQPAAVFGLHASPSSVQSRASEELGVCKVESLPLDIRELLKEEFELWKVQESTNLSVAARQRWKSEDPLECPGIAVGQFENVKLLSYAVLLVPRSHFDRGYKLVVFSPRAGRTTYESRVVEQSARSSAVDFFIHRVPISKFFNAQSRIKFQVQANEGILFADAGEKEYETDVYFWSDGSYRHQAVDY